MESDSPVKYKLRNHTCSFILYPLNCNRLEQFRERLSFDRSFLSHLRAIRCAPVYIHHARVYTRTMARSMVRVGVKSDSNYHSAIPRCGVNWLSRACLHSRAERTESCGGLEHLESSNKRSDKERGEGKGGCDPNRPFGSDPSEDFGEF